MSQNYILSLTLYDVGCQLDCIIMRTQQASMVKVSTELQEQIVPAESRSQYKWRASFGSSSFYILLSHLLVMVPIWMFTFHSIYFCCLLFSVCLPIMNNYHSLMNWWHCTASYFVFTLTNIFFNNSFTMYWGDNLKGSANNNTIQYFFKEYMCEIFWKNRLFFPKND